MIWTKTPPTKPGLYYWRTHDGDNKLRCREIWQGIYQLVVETGIPLEEFGGEWGGHCPAPGTTWNVEQIKTWMDDFDKPEIRIKHPTKYNNPQALINDPQSGIAATTARHRKEQR